VAVNQRADPNDEFASQQWWESLGTYDLSNGSLKVELSDAANGYVIADAVRVVPPGSSDPAIIKGPYLQNVTEDSIVVMWETDVPTGGRVEYGLASTNEFSVEEATPATIHEVELVGLTADTTYGYRVVSHAVTSSESTFATAPATERSFRFAVYGDSRHNVDNHAAVVQGVINSDPEFVLHTGDFIDSGNYEEWGPQFFDPAHDLLINTPMFSIKGDHEYDYYHDFFSLPNNERWYAFTYGNVRFIGLHLMVRERDYEPGSDQYEWLVSELESPEYASATWHVAFFHHPPYTALTSRNDTEEVVTHYVPLFEQYGVDLVLNGHSHLYERYFQNGVYYAVTGGGGAGGHTLAEDLRVPIRQVGVEADHHCVIDVDVPNASLTLSARLNDGSEVDSITLHKPPMVTVETLVTNDTTPELGGTVEDAAATIDVLVAGNSYSATNNGDGTWTLPDDAIDPALAVGTYDVAVTVTDWLGHVHTDETTDELVIDPTPPPSIESLTIAPDPVERGQDVTLTAVGVADLDGTVDSVSFYWDADGNGMFEVGTDPFLGLGSSGPDGWSLPASTDSLSAGTHRYFAQAADNDAQLSAVETASVEVAEFLEWIVDNGKAGFVKTGGNWQYCGHDPLRHTSDYFQTTSENTGETARWTFASLPPGSEYEVFARWRSRYDRARNAPFSVYDGGELLDTLQVDQVYDSGGTPGGWESLGTYTIESGTLVVQLTNTDVDGRVCADAVRVVKQREGGLALPVEARAVDRIMNDLRRLPDGGSTAEQTTVDLAPDDLDDALLEDLAGRHRPVPRFDLL